MNTYKHLTWDAVKAAAESLMHTYGTTTTLEVKNRLRNLGYWAVQAEVSSRIRCLADEAGWHVHSNGCFRIYSFASTDAVSSGPVHFALFLN